jgi:phage baseplate assembly protein W
MDVTALAFPFRVDDLGRVSAVGGDANLRAKIVEILLTAPGERVMQPEFGCGLRDVVFDPSNEILLATTEFAVSRALDRWLGSEILVENVHVRGEEGELQVEVTYARRDRIERGKVKIAF